MTIYGMPTLLMTRQLQSYVTNTREALDQARIEAVTGFAADVSEKVGGATGDIRRLEKLLEDDDKRLDAIALFQGEATIVQLTFEQTRENLAELQYDVLGAIPLENEATLSAAADSAASELKSLFGRLSGAHGGRYLFSGAKTDTPAVEDVDKVLKDVADLIDATHDTAGLDVVLDAYFDDPNGVYQTTIYQGSNNPAPDRELAEGRRLGIEATANDQSFRDAIRGLAVIAAIGTDSSNVYRDEILTEAADKLGAASEALINAGAKLGAQQEDAALLETRNRASTETYQLSINALLGVDQYEAASRMTQLETQLEAAYLTTSRLQSLSLVNYLR